MKPELTKIVLALIGKFSEEAAVCMATLTVKGIAAYNEMTSVFSDLLLFMALGTYLTLRLVRGFGLSKD